MDFIAGAAGGGFSSPAAPANKPEKRRLDYFIELDALETVL